MILTGSRSCWPKSRSVLCVNLLLFYDCVGVLCLTELLILLCLFAESWRCQARACKTQEGDHCLIRLSTICLSVFFCIFDWQLVFLRISTSISIYTVVGF